MQILILEDNPERKKAFHKGLGVRHHLAIVDTVELAIELAKTATENNDPFDVIFIDHDLGGEIYAASDEKNTGYQFAKWLQENNIKAQFVTHSLNPAGAMRICQVLPGCIHIPFFTLSSMMDRGLLL